MKEGAYKGEGCDTEDGVWQDERAGLHGGAETCLSVFELIASLPLSRPLGETGDADHYAYELQGGLGGVGVDSEHPEDVETWPGAGLGGYLGTSAGHSPR